MILLLSGPAAAEATVFMMVAVNNGGRVVMKTDHNWKWYEPALENVWFQPQAYQNSNNRRAVGVNPDPWGNQNDLVREYGSDVKSIYSPDTGDRMAHLYYKVSFRITTPGMHNPMLLLHQMSPQVGNGFSMNLFPGTYRVHITHVGGPATGMTRVEARR